MGTESKPGYDISMSKRTRRASNPSADAQDSHLNLLKQSTAAVLVSSNEEEDSSRTSLKQLIIINDNSNSIGTDNNCDHESKSRDRSSLGQHFTEEEKEQQQQQLQVVRISKQAVKLKGMMRRYVKVLSHLIKAKGSGGGDTPFIGSSTTTTTTRNPLHRLPHLPT